MNRLLTRLILFSWLTMVLSCRDSTSTETGTDDSASATETRTRGARRRVVSDEKKSWRSQWREARKGMDRNKIATYLAKAEDEMRGSEFAWMIEKAYEEGSNKQNDALVGGLVDLFSRTDMEKLPLWWQLTEYPELRTRLSKELGEALYRNGIGVEPSKDIAARLFTEKQEQADLMIGLTTAQMADDPAAAFDTYLSYGMQGGMKTLERFPEVIAKIPATANFAAMDEKIPRTEQHVAVMSREALYERWADANPADMVTHLVEGNHLGSGLVTALQKWHGKDPDASNAWMNEVISLGPNNAAWDGVHGAKAKMLLKEKNYAAAWQQMMQMQEFNVKRNTQAQIFNEWAKVDPKALKVAQKEFATRHAAELREYDRKVRGQK